MDEPPIDSISVPFSTDSSGKSLVRHFPGELSADNWRGGAALVGVQEEQSAAMAREKEREGGRERLSSGDGRRAKEDTKEDFDRPTDRLRACRAWALDHSTLHCFFCKSPSKITE